MKNLIIRPASNGFIVTPEYASHVCISREETKVCTSYPDLLEIIKESFATLDEKDKADGN